MNDQQRLRAAARAIAEARLAGRPQSLLPAEIRPRDLAEGYQVQGALHGELERAGHGSLAGHKIGCTSPVMQRYLAIDHPCAGGVFDTTVHEREATLRADRFLRLGVECEIAVRLSLDLPERPGGHDRTSVIEAVGAAMAAIELVEDRYDDFRLLDAPSLIADDFFNAGCVLGTPIAGGRELDLAVLEGCMRINGEEVARGHGRDILGHPLESLAWLANHLNGRGTKLRAGEFVLLGSVVRTVWLEPGDRVEIEVGALGDARLSLA